MMLKVSPATGLSSPTYSSYPLTVSTEAVYSTTYKLTTFKPETNISATYQPAAISSPTFQPATFKHVTVISHADWSKDPAKRWAAMAVLQPDQHWLAVELYNVRDPEDYIKRLISLRSTSGCILAGFDFPIGLPSAYAAQAGINSFLNALPTLGHGVWDEFYSPAVAAGQISLHRPFYPYRPGHARRQHLEHALGFPFNQLFRLCEKHHQNRRPACPLFWTLGGQQVGKAAISGWQSLLAPALAAPDQQLFIWPFAGPLSDLCMPGKLVVVETYPAEFYHHLGLSFTVPRRRSKRRQADRASFSAQLISWASSHHLDLPSSLLDGLQSGFGSHPEGEDQFDALVGLYGMINVVLGGHPCWEPNIPVISQVEGWIFGQEGPS